MVETLKDAKPYLTPPQVAERYGICLGTVYIWLHNGIMPASVQLGRKRLWWLADLQKWEDAGFPEQTRNEEKVEV